MILIWGEGSSPYKPDKSPPHTKEVEIGEGGRPITYVVYLPRLLKTVRCSVPGYPEVANSAGRMRENFMNRHFFAWISVVKERRETLPRCDLCSMHMPAGPLLKHQQKKRCNQNTQIQWRRRDVAIVS